MPLVAGAIAALGFAPWNLWPLTVLGIAGLLWLIERTPNRRAAFATGWVFGWGHFVVSLTWIATAFTYQAKMPPWLGWVAVVLLSAFLALYPGLAALAARSLVKRPAARVLVLAAAWMLAEWLRGHLLSGFAWNPLGVAWLAVPGVAQAASVIGGLGLSGLMVLAGGAVWANSRSRLCSARLGMGGGAPNRRVCWRCSHRRAVHCAPPRRRPGIPVHLVQPNIGQGEKYDPQSDARHLEKYLALSRAALAAHRGEPPALVVWSESAVLDTVEDNPALRAKLAGILRPGDLLLFGGVAVVRGPQGQVSAVTNSLFVLDARARLLGRYDKAHLVPLGEYVPARPLMEWIGLARLAAGDLDFAPGPGPATLDAPWLPGGGRADLLRDHLSGSGDRRSPSPRLHRQRLERRVVRADRAAATSGAGAVARDRGRPAAGARHADGDERARRCTRAPARLAAARR